MLNDTLQALVIGLIRYLLLTRYLLLYTKQWASSFSFHNDIHEVFVKQSHLPLSFGLLSGKSEVLLPLRRTVPGPGSTVDPPGIQSCHEERMLHNSTWMCYCLPSDLFTFAAFFERPGTRLTLPMFLNFWVYVYLSNIHIIFG